MLKTKLVNIRIKKFDSSFLLFCFSGNRDEWNTAEISFHFVSFHFNSHFISLRLMMMNCMISICERNCSFLFLGIFCDADLIPMGAWVRSAWHESFEFFIALFDFLVANILLNLIAMDWYKKLQYFFFFIKY